MRVYNTLCVCIYIHIGASRQVLEQFGFHICEIFPEHDCIYRLVESLQHCDLWNISNSGKLELIPDLPAGHVGHKYKIKHRVLLPQQRDPFEVNLAKSVSHFFAPENRVDQKPCITVMRTTASVVGLDVECSKN